MEGGEGLQANEVMQNTSCITVVGTKVELAHRRVVKLLVPVWAWQSRENHVIRYYLPLRHSLFYDGVLGADRFSEVSKHTRISKIQLLALKVHQYPWKLGHVIVT